MGVNCCLVGFRHSFHTVSFVVFLKLQLNATVSNCIYCTTADLVLGLTYNFLQHVALCSSGITLTQVWSKSRKILTETKVKLRFMKQRQQPSAINGWHG